MSRLRQYGGAVFVSLSNTEVHEEGGGGGGATLCPPPPPPTSCGRFTRRKRYNDQREGILNPGGRGSIAGFWGKTRRQKWRRRRARVMAWRPIVENQRGYWGGGVDCESRCEGCPPLAASGKHDTSCENGGERAAPAAGAMTHGERKLYFIYFFENYFSQLQRPRLEDLF